MFRRQSPNVLIDDYQADFSNWQAIPDQKESKQQKIGNV